MNRILKKLFSVKERKNKTVITVCGIKFRRKSKLWRGKSKYPEVFYIAFIQQYGFGDSLMSLPHIKEIRKLFKKPVVIDFYTKQPEAFKNLPFLDNAYHIDAMRKKRYYDLVLYSHGLGSIRRLNEDKLCHFSEQLYNYCLHRLQLFQNLYDINRCGFTLIFNKNCSEFLNLFGDLPSDRYTPKYMRWNEEAFKILDNYNLRDVKYITINRGADAKQFNHPKLWPLPYYQQLVKLLKNQYPNIKTVQIGDSMGFGDIGCDINLLEKTTFDDVKVLLKCAVLNISSEGGLVHLMNFLYGKSIVMFGATDVRILGYDQNINIIGSDCKTPCISVLPGWGDGCVKGYKVPPCMASITPDMVFQAVEKYLANLPVFDYITDYAQTVPFESAINAAQILRDDDSFEETAAAHNIDVTVYDDMSMPESNYKNNCDYIFYAKEKGFTAEYAFVYNIPAWNETYDMVYCSKLPSVNYKKFAINEMLRILKNNGLLVLNNIKEDLPEFNIFVKNITCNNKYVIIRKQKI